MKIADWGKERYLRFGRTTFGSWLLTALDRFGHAKCALHAAGLTYFSLLTLVPLLCCILVIAKMAHVDRYAREQINSRIDAMIVNVEKGQDDQFAKATASDETARLKKQAAAEEFARQARSISDQLFTRINDFDIGTFGWIGFATLLWTVISSISKVEMSFNGIWSVEKPRALWRRVLLYLGTVVVLPILLALAVSLPVLSGVKNLVVSTVGATDATRWLSSGILWFLDSRIFKFTVSLLFASLLFGLIYWVIPNRRIRFRDGWHSGVLTALLFGGWIRICAIAQVGISGASTLYGSFAFLPIVLAWIYMSWQIVLFGASMTYAFGARSVPGALGEGKR